MLSRIDSKSRLGGFYFFYFAVIGAFLPFFSLYLQEGGFTKSQIGWLMAIPMAARVVAPTIWGWLADVTGKKMPWIRLAIAAELISWSLLIVLPMSFWPYVLILIGFGFFQNAIVPILEVVTMDQAADKPQVYGQIRIWGSLGFIAAVFGLGLVFEVTDLSYLPWVLILVTLVAAAISFSIFDMHPIMEDEAAARIEDHPPLERFFKTLRQKKVMVFYTTLFVLLLSHAPFYSFYSNLLAEAGYSSGVIGMLWSLGVAAEVAMFMVGERFFKQPNLYKLTQLVLLLTALRWLITAAFTEVLALQIFAQLLHAFSFGLFQLVAMRFITKQFRVRQQARAQALYASTWGLGVALGSVVVGHYWDTTGGAFWFFFACVLVFVYTLLLKLLAKGVLAEAKL